MHRLKLQYLCNRIAITSANRKIQTNSVLLVKTKLTKVPLDDPGIRHQKALYNDDREFLNKLEDQEDPEPDEANLINAHAAYNQHYVEKIKRKRFITNKITKQKYFPQPKQPSMLTYSERETIKYLHSKDPVEWNVQKLSGSFPATPDIIIKILKNKLKLSPKAKRIKDKKVEENWKLLEEGKLNADPHYISHLKNFVNRRQGISETLKNKDFYLPEVKDEPVYNCGEMSGIISHYEKLIDKMLQNSAADTELLTNGLSEEKNLEVYDAQKQKSSLKILHEKIDVERRFRNITESDSFIMKSIPATHEKHKTFECLQKEILDKADANKNLELDDQAILEFTTGINSTNRSGPTRSDSEIDGKLGTEEEKKSIWSRIKYQELPAEMLEKETTIRLTSNDQNKSEPTIPEAGADGKVKNEKERESAQGSFKYQELPAEMLEKETTIKLTSHDQNKKEPAISEADERVETEEEKESTMSSFKYQELPAEVLEKETTIRLTSDGQNKSEPKISDADGKLEIEEEKETVWSSFNYRKLPGENLEKDTTIKITDNDANECNVDWAENKTSSRINERKLRKKLLSERKNFPPPDENTFLGNETNIGQFLDKLKEPKKLEDNELGNEAKKLVIDPEKERWEELYFEKQKEDIKNTSFWNDPRSSSKKAMAELEKAPLKEPKDLNKVTLCDVSCHDFYPEKINIPKSKRGTGLTFKVNDCYYDDDGEFLYRVPGMTK